MKLTDIEEQLDENDLFLKWLIEKRVNFKDLSERYTQYLENENQKIITKSTRYSNLLAQYLQYGDLSNKTEWVRDKTIGTLYAYEDFKTAPIYDKWKEIIENNKINTNLNTLDYEIYTKGENNNK